MHTVLACIPSNFAKNSGNSAILAKNISEILSFPSYFLNLRTEPKYLFVLSFTYVWGSIGQRDILVPSAGVETVTKHVQHSPKFLFSGKR